MRLQQDDSKVDSEITGHKFGLLSQSVHFVRQKANLLTDLLAKFLVKFSVDNDLPRHVDAKYLVNDRNVLAYDFSFTVKQNNTFPSGKDTGNWIQDVAGKINELLPTGTLAKDMEKDEKVHLYMKSKSNVLAAYDTLNALLLEFGAKDVDNSAFRELLIQLLNLSPESLTGLILLLSSKDDEMGLTVDISTLRLDEFHQAILFSDVHGDITCLRVTPKAKKGLWQLLRNLLEKIFGSAIVSHFELLSVEGDTYLKKEEEEKANKQKGKQKSTKKPKAWDIEWNRLQALKRNKVCDDFLMRICRRFLANPQHWVSNIN